MIQRFKPESQLIRQTPEKIIEAKKTKPSGGMKKSERETLTSGIMISDLRGEKMDKDSKKNIELALNQKHLGRKKKSNGTFKYKTKQKIRTDRPNKISSGT